MKYIRQRENGTYQLRMYDSVRKISITDSNLDNIIKARNNILGYDPDAIESKPRILLIDIETAPILAYVWGLWKQDIGINQIVDDSYMLCFAYKWLNDHTVSTKSLIDYETDYLRGAEVELLKDLHELLNEADIVIAHNADKFDVKKINTYFLKHGFNKPTPYKVVDTLKIAKRKFRFTSNKLAYITDFLEGTNKLENSGMSLWIGCMEGNSNSWKEMLNYNVQDVLALEDVYIKLRAWDNHPNLGHYYNDDKTRCTTCGGTNFENIKPVYTNVSAFSAIRCLDCSQVMRLRKSFKRQPVVNAL